MTIRFSPIPNVRDDTRETKLLPLCDTSGAIHYFCDCYQSKRVFRSTRIACAHGRLLVRAYYTVRHDCLPTRVVWTGQTSLFSGVFAHDRYRSTTGRLVRHDDISRTDGQTGTRARGGYMVFSPRNGRKKKSTHKNSVNPLVCTVVSESPTTPIKRKNKIRACSLMTIIWFECPM